MSAIDLIRARAPDFAPKVGLILGSGLSGFADTLDDGVAISYADLPGFPETGVAGHAGRLLLGSVSGMPVAVMQGRTHYYESGQAGGMKIPVRTLAALGVECMIITNAAGSVNPGTGPGSIMLVSDHINFTGVSPLFGEPDSARFVDLCGAYDQNLRAMFHKAAAAAGIDLDDGVYMWFCGPNFETPAEIRAANILGADAVGMSTVPEVILARHAGLKVAALSVITNLAAGLSDTPLSHAQTMAAADRASQALQILLTGFLARYQGQIR
ncbi:MAG: purine-nucleoside phosphorylase [Proteobacteria bacterium]|nr:purine-nucleoside phosphorylase [Pseudomonadota bacterium]